MSLRIGQVLSFPEVQVLQTISKDDVGIYLQHQFYGPEEQPSDQQIFAQYSSVLQYQSRSWQYDGNQWKSDTWKRMKVLLTFSQNYIRNFIFMNVSNFIKQNISYHYFSFFFFLYFYIAIFASPGLIGVCFLYSIE